MVATTQNGIGQLDPLAAEAEVSALLAALHWLDRRLEHAVSAAQVGYRPHATTLIQTLACSAGPSHACLRPGPDPTATAKQILHRGQGRSTWSRREPDRLKLSSIRWSRHESGCVIGMPDQYVAEKCGGTDRSHRGAHRCVSHPPCLRQNMLPPILNWSDRVPCIYPRRVGAYPSIWSPLGMLCACRMALASAGCLDPLLS